LASAFRMANTCPVVRIPDKFHLFMSVYAVTSPKPKPEKSKLIG
jgi:hypothetical protein